MCTPQIIQVNGKYGTFTFSSGYSFPKEESVLDWAQRDLGACMSYLIKHGRSAEAQELWDDAIHTSSEKVFESMVSWIKRT